MKDINLAQLSTRAKSLVKKLQRYSIFIFIMSVLAAYVFLVFRIGTLAQSEPDQAAVAEQANTVKRLRLDQEAITKIQDLQDQNIAVDSIFKTARDNPFESQ